MILLLLAYGGLACAPDVADDTAASCAATGRTLFFVMDTIGYGRRNDDGTTVGFDLDGVVSSADDAQGCYQPDLVSPEGVPGIDSAFSGIVPALEATEAVAVEGLLQSSINNGELLIGVEVSGYDGLNDDCVNVRLMHLSGPASVATDGYLEQNWTWAIDPNIPALTVEGVPVVDGKIDAGPYEFPLPLQILDGVIDTTLHGLYVRIEVDESSGRASGWFGGGLEVAYILDRISVFGVNEEVRSLIVGLVQALADLYPDAAGACTQLSLVFSYTATAGYVYE